MPKQFFSWIYFKIVEEPYQVKKRKNLSLTPLYISFSSSKITVEKEIVSYSYLSFVADCGGLLGLFIGFNFVMFWDLIVIIYRKILRII